MSVHDMSLAVRKKLLHIMCFSIDFYCSICICFSRMNVKYELFYRV